MTGKLDDRGVRPTRRSVPLPGERARVLIVEDNESAACALAALLDAEGYEIREASSGVDAIEKIDTWVPHVVLLDISLGGHDGFQVASIIRGMRATAHIGIIATSGYDKNELRGMGCLTNFDALFQKGRDDGHQLLGLVKSILLSDVH